MNGAEFLDHVTDTLGLRALFGVEQVDMIHVQIPLGHVRMRVNGGPALLLKVTGRRSEVHAPILRTVNVPAHTVRQIDVTAYRDSAAEFTLEARPVDTPPANVREAHYARTVPRPVPAIELLDHLAEWTVR